MIYCVEDEKNIRELEIYALEASGFAAVGLENGRELEQKLAQELPELILLDIMMPGMDGYQLLKYMRERVYYSNIPVIVITGDEKFETKK